MKLTATPVKPMVRCAIYTRKSTEEGLDQEFNSLDAQREAGESYINSQKHEGWVMIPTRYDDGGISGATLERPALQRLLADCRAGKVDCIVVYKVDRLSRSLLDFSRLVETFNAANVTFVSVTQHFNTNDSMGRLTLNILLSFAQFEREVITDRIRDKMSACRKKGKWVGGCPSFGYDVDYQAKRLVINETEAKWVRRIFERFVQTRSASVVLKELAQNGITTKTWTSKTQRRIKGRAWNRGSLYKFLNNRTYLGQVDYKGSVYDGEHPAIVTQAAWDAVQNTLAEGPGIKIGRSLKQPNPAFLVGLVRCAHCGRAMSPSFTKGRSGARYRYYRCQSDQKNGAESCPVGSIPAGDLEKEVLKHLRRIFQSPEVLSATSRQARIQGKENGNPVDHLSVVESLGKIDAVWDELYPGEQNRIAALLIRQIEVDLDRVAMTIRVSGLEHLLGLNPNNTNDDGTVEIVLPVKCRRVCGRTRLIGPKQSPEEEPTERNETLEAIARASAWQEALESGKVASISELATAEGVDESFIRRQLPLALMEPKIVEGMVEER